MQGLHSKADLERALDDGISVLRPHLETVALELRRLSAYPLGIFLSNSLNDPVAVLRIADTVRALEALRPATSGTNS